MLNETKKQLKGEFGTEFREGDNAWHPNFELLVDWWLKKIDSLLKSQRDSLEKDIKNKVGFLRQWLNEDRITDVNKMVDSKDLLFWLIKEDK